MLLIFLSKDMNQLKVHTNIQVLIECLSSDDEPF